MIAWEQPPPLPSAYITTGSREVDELLGGSIRLGLITEVSGEAGTGKTILAKTLAITAQLPKARGGISGCAVYLHSRKTPTLDTNVLLDIGKRYGFQGDMEVLRKITVTTIESATNLPGQLMRAERCSTADGGRLGLVLIDDLATVAREEFPSFARYQPRHRAISNILDEARRIVLERNCAVVIVNEVVDCPITDGRTGSVTHYKRPFGGPALSRPNIDRICLMRRVDVGGDRVRRTCKRYVSPTRSPEEIARAAAEVNFKIDDHGFCDDNDHDD